MASTTTTRYFSSTRTRSTSPAARVMTNRGCSPRNREEEFQQTVRNMCRPPLNHGTTTRSTSPGPRTTTTRILQKPAYRDVTTVIDKDKSPGERALSAFRRGRDGRPCDDGYVNKCWKEMDKEIDNMHNYVDNFVKKMDCIWDDTVRKAHHSTSMPKLNDISSATVTDEFSASPQPVERVDVDGTKRLVYSLDLCGYKPEEIKVNLNIDDGELTVTACHEENECGKFYKRSYSRKFIIAENMRLRVDTSAFRSFLNDQGTLSIEAPLKVSIPFDC